MPPPDERPRCPKCGRPETANHAVVCPAQYAGTVGTTIDDRYVVESILGQGGMGVVFRADQVSVHRPVAIKMLHSSLASAAQFYERFRREAELASRLHHPHIISIYDFGKLADGACYYVMELLEGENLRKKIKREGAFSLNRALTVADQVARALGHAHAANIIHRDLKPQNVMCTVVDNQDYVKVLDFGLVKMLEEETEEDDEGLTSTGQILGTPQYMAPEQAAGDPVDQRADLYSLGVVTYYMLAGSAPYGQKTAHAALLAAMSEPIPPVSTYRPDAPLPESLDVFLRRALAYKREERPPTAEAFIEEFRAAAKNVPAEAANAKPAKRDAPEPGPSGGTQRTVAARGRASSDAGASKASPPAAATPVRQLPTKAIAGVGLVVAAAVIGFVATRSSPRTSATDAPSPKAAPELTAMAQPNPVVTLHVASDPPGASVYDGQVLLGTSPATLVFPRQRAIVELTLKLEGYLPQERGVDLTHAPMSSPMEFSMTLTRAPVAQPQPASIPAAAPSKRKAKKASEANIPTFDD